MPWAPGPDLRSLNQSRYSFDWVTTITKDPRSCRNVTVMGIVRTWNDFVNIIYLVNSINFIIFIMIPRWFRSVNILPKPQPIK